MTSYAQTSVTCGACGHIFTRQGLMSTNAFGSADLDTRPPEMRRSTMDAWITCCPSCGYCSSSIDWFNDKFRAVLETAAYRSQLGDSSYPALANTFICHAMLMNAIGERNADAWSHLRAAWTLDDAKRDELASIWRGQAADIFIALLREGHPSKAQPGAQEALATDCLRRAGRGNEALALLDAVSIQNFDDAIQKLFTFQRALIQRGDTGRHLISEALGSRKGADRF